MSKYISLALGPLAFFLILFLYPNLYLESEGWEVLALAAWMITWWVTEAVPISITAILPMIIFPLLGVFDIKDATSPYASSIIFLFMGGFMLALAMEEHNLHKRIALSIIKITGVSGNGIILGFMIATASLSMWISNTATAVMMLPIALSVVGLLEKTYKPEYLNQFKLGLLLSIAYSANIGGIGTIIGTPPNVVLVGYMESFYGISIDFLDWMLVGIPVVIVLLVITYFLIVKVLFPIKKLEVSGTNILLENEIKKLGRWTNEQKMVAVVFVLTAIGWVFKQQINQLIGAPLLNDTVTAMMGGVAMFSLPINKKGKMLMEWEAMKRLPWGILILFGGGICLAKGMEKSGVVNLLAEIVSGDNHMVLWVVIAILTAIMLFMTELMSNVALTTIFIPVVIGIASGLGVSPFYLVVPVTMAASCAFMMPISTPPNAVVFSSGFIRIRDMMKAGVILNLISIVVLVIAALTIVKWIW
ncbi:MAG: DASS family sodium-coupled anion symporter [Cyclobacteriaceae bacterium]|nr:DASS family sodium-coupled anion symporter [Cyclobacteriaceae bacterium]